MYNLELVREEDGARIYRRDCGELRAATGKTVESTREVREAGKAVMIHSCGAVDELFDELIALGLNCFNPFQPEVMDVDDVFRRYHGRLSFFGGLSTQRTLPFGSVEDVRRETAHLLDLGRDGSYVFATGHAVEGDVPLENMLAFIDTVRAQRAQ
jgi:uroporphyrinogen decarboxylase